MSEIVFTDRELDVMSVLWELGSGTVSDVRERLDDELAYTTVLTVLQTLEEKGHVGHVEEGRAYRWHPEVESGAARESALRRLTRKLFRGSPELLLTHLVASRELSDEDLRRLRALLDEKLDDGTDGSGAGEEDDR